MADLIRPWHTIQPNHVTRLPARVVYLAVRGRAVEVSHPESERWETLDSWAMMSVRYRGGRVHNTVWSHGAQVADWWERLCGQLPKRGRVWIVCQSAATSLTLLRLWERIDAELFSLQGACIDGLPWIVTLRYGTCTIVICDRQNWIPGLAHLEGDAQAEVVELAQEGLSLRRWWLKWDCGTFRPTTSGCAWSIWRHSHYTHPVTIHGHKPTLELERAAYRGGRVAVRRLGRVEGPVYVLDMRSAYPWIMATHNLPCQLDHYTPLATRLDPSCWPKDSTCVAQVDLQARHDYPHKREDGRIEYVRGRMQTTLCGAELSRALADGEVLAVGAVAYYTTAPTLAQWGQWYWYALGEAERGSCPVLVDWIKALGRSLYGRWGMRSEEWSDWPERKPPERWGPFWQIDRQAGTYQACRAVAGLAQRRGKIAEAPDSSPVIAACVTSALRVHIDQLCHVAGERQVYYRDTDEIHTSERGYRALCDHGEVSDAFGALRIKAIGRVAEYYGPRHYRLDDKLVWAGVGGSKVAVGPHGLLQVHVTERSKSILSRDLDGTVRTTLYDLRPTAWMPPAGVDEKGWIRPLIVGGECDGR